MSTAKEAIGGVSLGRAEPLFPAAIRAGGLLFLSGQAPIDPATSAVCAADFAGQATFVLDRIAQTLDSARASMADVVRIECILARAEDFAAWNEIFAARFATPRPARTTFVASFVIPGMLLEIQVTAATTFPALTGDPREGRM
jgi:2-iminobutanoate/2-iminopropanoate deaminase